MIEITTDNAEELAKAITEAAAAATEIGAPIGIVALAGTPHEYEHNDTSRPWGYAPTEALELGMAYRWGNHFATIHP